ncbi:TPA: hypothetical protein N0F65_001458 [Lagenidium giganteum]|uniref:Inositol oxygenase n=1 Tax=Lagenidium giganteum TaxID=4803 RepID=A0AAV2YFY6_9STRA|nr:TPA: hypothetical protein N0F65_001458 [Lagenidium giganteum]
MPVVLVTIAIVIIVILATRKSSKGSSSNNAGGDDATAKNVTRGPSCAKPVAPHRRVVAFWQSETDGCDRVPKGVTHVVFGFALVSDGRVVPSFQNTDKYIQTCVEKLRSKCIYTMASIGGSTNNHNLSSATDATKFASSAVSLIDKFGFDGLDIDDETVGSEYNAVHVVSRIKATREALQAKDKSLLLTYDAYFFEGVPSFCASPTNAPYTRCFPPQVLYHVDWINIMAYNVNKQPTEAAKIYQQALNTTFVDWSKQLDGDFTRATIGFCVKDSCAYGPGPSKDVIADWAAFAQRPKAGGGVMIYSASTEAVDDFPETISLRMVAHTRMAVTSSATMTPSLDGSSHALGARVPLTEVVSSARFRVEFTHDARARELRWVLFTNGRRGAIGKIIFTLENCAQSAHIKSIVVNKEYRGLGLARVLYMACVSTLQELHVPELHLEAEEDTRRHGKLVGLYREWGFAEKPDAKVLFLYNDTECFRKVPMMLSFQARPVASFPSKTEAGAWFCMLVLKTPDGTCLVASEDGLLEARRDKSHESMWQTLLGQDGEIFLRSVHGKFLCVEESGNVLADRHLNSTWETFQVVPHRSMNADDQSGAVAGGVALRNFHGGYLSIDAAAQTVKSSSEPVVWDAGDLINLVCGKSDTVPIYHKIMRKYQTKAFVQRQVAQFTSFQHATMTVAEACKALVSLNGDVDANASWVLKYMLASAEAVRQDGHPDWLQLVVFLRGLGLLFLLWTDEDNAILRSISPAEWLCQMTTWVVGRTIPSAIAFPELNELNADHCSPPCKDEDIETGMEHALLPWTPDEYLFRVLEFNKASLPSEALAVTRFWSLKTWHQQGHYDDLCAPQDFDTKEFLASLEDVSVVSDQAMQAVATDKLLPYYLSLAEKFLPRELQCGEAPGSPT